MWANRGLCVLCNISVIGLRAIPTQLDEYTVGLHTVMLWMCLQTCSAVCVT